MIQTTRLKEMDHNFTASKTLHVDWRDTALDGIGLYRDVWIAAIASSTTSLATRTAAICVRFQGRRVRRVYVTMQITFLTRKSALIYRRGLRQRVASLTLNCNGDFAIRAYEEEHHWGQLVDSSSSRYRLNKLRQTRFSSSQFCHGLHLLLFRWLSCPG